MTGSPDKKGPLGGIVVIDLTRVLSGPYCTLLLADLGARVIKVESLAGDDSRQFGPFHDGQSAYFASFNRGKESIALDLKSPTDRTIFERLLDRADILVDNFRPGVMARLGFGTETIAQRWPRVIHAGISGFGQDGPDAHRAAFDLVLQGMGGLMHLTGAEGGGPARAGSSFVDIGTGMFAAVGILAALHERGTTGKGRFVDIAMLDSTVAILEHALVRAQLTPPVERTGARFPTSCPSDAYRTRDGWLVIACATQDRFEVAMRLLGLEALIIDRRFAELSDRLANNAALKVEIEAVLAGGDTAVWDSKLADAGVPCGPLRSPDDLLADPQLGVRNMLLSWNGIKVAGNPVKIPGYPESGLSPSAPSLDGDRAALLAELGL
jgi:CoA:oxalate CoA-transferase